MCAGAGGGGGEDATRDAKGMGAHVELQFSPTKSSGKDHLTQICGEFKATLQAPIQLSWIYES